MTDATEYPDLIEITVKSDVPSYIYGERAAAVARLVSAGMPTPHSWSVSQSAFKAFTQSGYDWPHSFADKFEKNPIVSVRASPIRRVWAAPESLLNVGMNDQIAEILNKAVAPSFGWAAYFDFIAEFSARVARLDAEEFIEIKERNNGGEICDYEAACEEALDLFEEEKERPFPRDLDAQLRELLRSMGQAWNGTSARIIRESHGAPSDAGLGLVIQEVGLGLGKGEFGAGRAQFASPITGEIEAYGRYRRIRKDAKTQGIETQDLFLSSDPRGEALEDRVPEVFQTLRSHCDALRKTFKDECQVDFAIDNDCLRLLDARPAERSGRSNIATTVRLKNAKIISKQEAIMRIDPRQVEEILHPSIDPKAAKLEIARGIGASPGAACGKLVFSASGAARATARGEQVILAKIETAPDDVHGMSAAQGIVTERGGINGHSAVVARALGLPCIANASKISIDERNETITLGDNTRLRAGDFITIDGHSGQIFQGSLRLIPPDFGSDFQKLMRWADTTRKLKIRCNADTPQDVRTASQFGVDGIGLIRTEHMFFDDARLSVMRELIFTEDARARQRALEILRPMQRSDFEEIFREMGQKPVAIRLLDPPLHEFLPKTRNQIKALADAMDVPISTITRQIEDMHEINPMLGTRGVRLGITMPEIYDMQARAIFEAACHISRETHHKIQPEIMIPLVSVKREVEIIKARIDGIASAIMQEFDTELAYRFGVMIETPRAAIIAGDLAKGVDFMSFGTNDLTQMTYGLSRDDAARFMQSYLKKSVFEADPFASLDLDGVGQLMRFAVKNARASSPLLDIGLCGEQAVDPASLAFCAELEFDYISCSAYRTPIAKLAAARLALDSKKE